MKWVERLITIIVVFLVFFILTQTLWNIGLSGVPIMLWASIVTSMMFVIWLIIRAL